MFNKLLERVGCCSEQTNGGKEIVIPMNNADETVWREFVNNADWQTILRAYQSHVSREDENLKHDENVKKILRERLFLLEQPVFSEKFIRKQKRLFVVDDDASNQEIKDFVAMFHTKELPPKYIVEESGRLRGIALAEDLILVGVTPVVGTFAELTQQANLQNVSLLDEYDSRCVDTYWEELVSLMEKANVPTLKGVRYWNVCGDGQKNLHISFANLPMAVELSDKTVLLAKL